MARVVFVDVEQQKAFFSGGIDAAVVWDDHVAYFFRGAEYTAFGVGWAGVRVERRAAGAPARTHDVW